MNQGSNFSKTKYIAPVDGMPQTLQVTDKEVLIPNNNEMSVLHIPLREIWNRKESVMNDTFSYAVASEIIKGDDDNDNTEPPTIQECRQTKDWPKWKDVIQAELDSLTKRGVLRKRNEVPCFITCLDKFAGQQQATLAQT